MMQLWLRWCEAFGGKYNKFVVKNAIAFTYSYTCQFSTKKKKTNLKRINIIVREQDELPCAFHGESKQLI